MRRILSILFPFLFLFLMCPSYAMQHDEDDVYAYELGLLLSDGREYIPAPPWFIPFNERLREITSQRLGVSLAVPAMGLFTLLAQRVMNGIEDPNMRIITQAIMTWMYFAMEFDVQDRLQRRMNIYDLE